MEILNKKEKNKKTHLSYRQTIKNVIYYMP